jgi:hypothetical protein
MFHDFDGIEEYRPVILRVCEYQFMSDVYTIRITQPQLAGAIKK